MRVLLRLALLFFFLPTLSDRSFAGEMVEQLVGTWRDGSGRLWTFTANNEIDCRHGEKACDDLRDGAPMLVLGSGGCWNTVRFLYADHTERDYGYEQVGDRIILREKRGCDGVGDDIFVILEPQ